MICFLRFLCHLILQKLKDMTETLTFNPNLPLDKEALLAALCLSCFEEQKQ